MSDTDAARIVKAWAAAVDRLVAVAPLAVVMDELGIPARGHTTTDERKAIRVEAHATVARWLARDLARLAETEP